MPDFEKPSVASLIWERNFHLHEVQGRVIEGLGYSHSFFCFDEDIPAGTDVVFIQGPYGSLLPFVRRLMAYPPPQRPVLVYWFQQNLRLFRPQWLNLYMARLLSDLHRGSGDMDLLARGLQTIAPGFLNGKGKSIANIGDILWLHRRGFLDVLGLTGSVYVDFLSRFNIPSTLVMRGYHPEYGKILDVPRDVALLWMGNLRTRRRREAVYGLREELKRRGLTMHIHDGVERGYIHGDERTQALNRCWFVLNLYAHPKDELSIRYFIAAANGAVILSEPGENRYPFIPGEHYVESTLEDMPDTIQHYLDHPEEWQAISRAMYTLVTENYTLEQSVAKLLNRAEAVLKERKIAR